MTLHSPKRGTTAVDRQIGTRIRDRRVTLGMTQENLATGLGLTYQQIHKYERGINRVSVVRLLDIAKVLDVEPQALFAGIESDCQTAAFPRMTLETARMIAAAPEELQRKLHEVVRLFCGKSLVADDAEISGRSNPPVVLDLTKQNATPNGA